ncbi:MAG TPA: DNA repair protein RecN [Thermoanaerobaculia bacterium]|nr:DNA repair protein RecN [Thermoanaerobaculia bacterium]
MLRELHVRNLAVLAEASVTFGDGLNVLSGETGAGKSIVVDSLFLLAGARASTEMIRSGAEALTVSGVFAPAGGGWRRVLEEAGLAIDPADGPAGEAGEVLVRREIGRNGRNRVFVNDQPTTLRLLADLAPHLLRIHGQRDEMELLASDLQREWLDASGGEPAARLTAGTAETHARHARLAERLERLGGDQRLRQERIDLLRFQAGEIDAARPRAGEDQELRRERETLRHSEAITRALGTAFSLLLDEEGAAAERVARSQALLAAVGEWEPAATGWAAELEEARIRLTELASALGRRLDGLDPDPARLDAVEERLALLERLCRRHGGDLAQVLARRAEIAAELAELEGDAGNQDELRAQAEAALGDYREAALALSSARRGWGEALAGRIEAELQDLGLARARLAVRLDRRRRAGSALVVDGEAVDFGPHGIDQVTLLFAPNPGEEARPLARIASGGELSRLHLALQLAAGAAGGDPATVAAAAHPTLVFDEIDAGIGGAEAAALGRKLQRLAGGGQILAVTHLPQVASHADLHFRVRKTVAAGRTSVQVEPLPPRDRVEEVARMLAGDKLTPLSLSHAEELIAGAARQPRPAAGGRARRPAPA